MSKGKIIGYIRVSTDEQNPERQLQGIQLDKSFIEYASGSKTDRYQLDRLMEYVRDEDLVIVHSMDRLARNVRHLLQLIETLTKKGAKIQFIKENLTFSGDDSPTSKLLLTIMGAVAEFELSMIKERQKEGIAIAKAEGKYKGKKPSITPEKKEIIMEELKTRKPLNLIAQELNISRTTLYKFLQKIGLENYRKILKFGPKNSTCEEFEKIEEGTIGLIRNE